MTHVNKVTLQGAVGRYIQTNANNTVCKVSLLTEAFYKDKKYTEYHALVFFQPLVDQASSLREGYEVAIEGRIHNEKYVDKDGVEKRSTKIIVSKLEILEYSAAPEKAPNDDIPF